MSKIITILKIGCFVAILYFLYKIEEGINTYTDTLYYVIGFGIVLLISIVLSVIKNKIKKSYLEEEHIDKNKDYYGYSQNDYDQTNNYNNIAENHEDDDEDFEEKIFYYNDNPYNIDELRNKISNVLKDLIRFKSEYDLKENVSSEIFVEVNNKKINLDFVLYKNEKLALVIDVEQHNIKQKYVYDIVKEYFEDKDVSFLTFFTHLPNTESYIENRIKDNL